MYAVSSVGKKVPTGLPSCGKDPPGTRPLRLLLLEQPSGYRQFPLWVLSCRKEVLIV